MKAYIFYNGDDIVIPSEKEYSNWGGYRNPDSAKMFAVCADSWERQGWEVKRLICPPSNNYWKGRLSCSSYPYNGLIPAIVESGLHRGGMFMVTTDVINLGFIYTWDCYAYIPFPHFTMAAGWFSEQWFEDALMILHSYDAGLLRDVPEHTDEGVLRHNMDMQKYCLGCSELKHYSRSTIARELKKHEINTI